MWRWCLVVWLGVLYIAVASVWLLRVAGIPMTGDVFLRLSTGVFPEGEGRLLRPSKYVVGSVEDIRNGERVT